MNVGAAKVIISMLRMAGILQCEKCDDNDISKLKLAPDWNECTFMLSGNGLSQVRAQSLDDLISSTGGSFGLQHKMRSTNGNRI